MLAGCAASAFDVQDRLRPEGAKYINNETANRNIAPLQGFVSGNLQPGASPPADILRPYRAVNY